MPAFWWVVPFVVQGAAIALDELYFHRRRGLGRWERWGHPVDTLAFLVCLAIVGLFPKSEVGSAGFVACAVFSALLITKDEWVHARECSPAEHWLHALLFILHPVALGAAWIVWPTLHRPEALAERTIFLAYLGSISFFLVYQTVYWNLAYVKRSRAHQ